MFVYDEHGIGLGYFTYANTELVIHKISIEQCSGVNMELYVDHMFLNFNGIHGSTQRAIYLTINNTVSGSECGHVIYEDQTKPNYHNVTNTIACYINEEQISEAISNVDPMCRHFIFEDERAQVIAHELGHAVGLAAKDKAWSIIKQYHNPLPDEYAELYFNGGSFRSIMGNGFYSECFMYQQLNPDKILWELHPEYHSQYRSYDYNTWWHVSDMEIIRYFGGTTKNTIRLRF